MARTTRIGFVFIPGFADWEFGFLSGSAVGWFGAKTFVLTPGGEAVTSIGGLTLAGQRGLAPEENEDLDALAMIGSDTWAGENPPDAAPLLAAAASRDSVIGGICAGTLAVARAGLFKHRAHTSNGREWIAQHLPGYAGAENYRDVPYAVTDGRLVSAPGSAPGTFAVEFLAALYPDRGEQLSQMRALFGSEYRDDRAAAS